MSYSTSTFSVRPGAGCVPRARRWVVDTLGDLGRPELAETSGLAVTELVTNAILHAEQPITVHVRGTQERPRIEVRDASPEAPEMPETRVLEEVDEDSLLATFGRGLDIVARCAGAWGAELEPDGKVMWFSPTDSPNEEAVPGTVTGETETTTREPGDTETFRMLDVPLDQLADFERHYRELRREARLLTLAHEDEYPLARRLADLFGELEHELRHGLDLDQLRAARRDGLDTLDLEVRLPCESAETMGRFINLLDFADEFCREERMLALARTPEQEMFQTWFMTEFVRQRNGQAPSPYRKHVRRVRAQA